MKRSRVKTGKRPVSAKKKLEKELDTVWSLVIRGRDKSCCRCGGYGSLQAHHIFSRRHKSTRWDERNGVALCHPCHIFWAHRDVGSFIAWYIEKYTKRRFDSLSKKSKEIAKWTEESLGKMLKELKSIREAQ